jgi:hypothetical protein
MVENIKSNIGWTTRLFNIVVIFVIPLLLCIYLPNEVVNKFPAWIGYHNEEDIFVYSHVLSLFFTWVFVVNGILLFLHCICRYEYRLEVFTLDHALRQNYGEYNPVELGIKSKEDLAKLILAEKEVIMKEPAKDFSIVHLKIALFLRFIYMGFGMFDEGLKK